ncbi:MAG: acylphosphatase [Gemmatimonadota bacterium]|nr:acylphosphatase [Gemmatimonadota bacterium]MDE2832522.1 acylphosphatase [Gemmatimonadota bacterium]
MGNIKRIRVTISGRVQGVGFRYFTQREGERLGLVGWVKNLSNGDVKAEAEGNETQVDAFVEAIRRGPPASRILNFQIVEIPANHRDVGFDIRFF